LQGSDYHLSFIDDPTLKRSSITLTGRTVSIAFSKEVGKIEPLGYVGVDVNERNVTIALAHTYTRRFDELGDVAEIKERYREIRAKIGRTMRKDNRINRRLYAKFGRREGNRSIQRIHKVSKEIVACAEVNQCGIILEKLTGITKLYRKGNGQRKTLRGRMNSWMFFEIQRQIEYKAGWDGIAVRYVNPKGTSRNCPDCGSRVVRLAGRKLYCQKCDRTWDRDVLASKNLAAAVVPAAQSPKGNDEGESRTQETAGNPQSGWVKVEVSGRCPNTLAEPNGSNLRCYG
jgi:putative transposase